MTTIGLLSGDIIQCTEKPEMVQSKIEAAYTTWITVTLVNGRARRIRASSITDFGAA